MNNRGGFALFSDGLRVDGTMFCRNGFTAQGEVRLPGAQIGGRLYFDGAKLSNPGGRALVASRLTVGQDMFCRNQEFPTTSSRLSPRARSSWAAPTSAATSTAPGRSCATTPAPPCTPTACKSIRTCS